MLNDKIAEAAEKSADAEEETSAAKQSAKKEEGFFDNPMVKSAGRTAATMITRSLLGALGLGGRSRSKKSWF